METSHAQPVQLQNRTVIIDVLRGWALFGVVLMNYFDFFTLDRDWTRFKPDELTNWLMYATSYIFAAKSWTLLSILFGYGFAVLMNNIKEKGHDPYLFFAGRMFWLLVLAVINSALFFGDILKDYAVLGLFLLPFYKSRARTTFIISLLLLAGIPALVPYVYSLNNTNLMQLPQLFPLYQSHHLIDVLTFGLKATWLTEVTNKPYLFNVHAVMFCCMLWGFSLYQINFFNDLPGKLKLAKRTFWLALLTSILLYLSFILAQRYQLTYNQYYNVRYWFILSSMLTIGTGIIWLFLSGKLQALFHYFAVFGRMTLTNYMVQNLIGLLVFSGFGLGIWNTKPAWFYLALAVAVYIVQIYFSKWWLTHYNFGPVEWIWRQLSYRKRLPLRK